MSKVVDRQIQKENLGRIHDPRDLSLANSTAGYVSAREGSRRGCSCLRSMLIDEEDECAGGKCSTETERATACRCVWYSVRASVWVEQGGVIKTHCVHAAYELTNDFL